MSNHTTASTGMYPVRPAIVLPAKFPYSSSMYRIQNIHEEFTAVTQPVTRPAAEVEMSDDAVVSQAPLPEYEALEARQEKILNQLAELKLQVTTLCRFLKQSNQVETVKDSGAVQKSFHLVLNVGPKNPPYSIMALQKVWKDTDFNVISHIHSTMKGEIPITFPKHRSSSNVKNIFKLTLIWKDIPDVEVVVDPHSRSVRGEVNFLRLVSRMLESHNYENTCLQPEMLDSRLDLIHFLHTLQNIKVGLATLAEDFERWSCHGEFNIVDIAAWSLIKRKRETVLPLILRKWYAQCESAFTEKTD